MHLTRKRYTFHVYRRRASFLSSSLPVFALVLAAAVFCLAFLAVTQLALLRRAFKMCAAGTDECLRERTFDLIRPSGKSFLLLPSLLLLGHSCASHSHCLSKPLSDECEGETQLRRLFPHSTNGCHSPLIFVRICGQLPRSLRVPP